ncbi:MAG: hypothetical protein LQ340_004522 [Diploschistes diacapsis]|nr:MAG: hypothetical protein LQ340_004522 [Diploschistes diacapsis]
MSTASSPRSTFFDRGICATPGDLSVLHLKRDLKVSVLLRTHDENEEGYEEGKVTNTRFGSFPHSTLIGVPWGSQVRASNVDTGSRGHGRKKRKREDGSLQDAEKQDGGACKAPTLANSGFVHLLPPTPESWTASLPHRTQVVYMHDASYILQRLRARPGSTIIEAGAGSGSFTHAAARAARGSGGKVLSFEFHQQRYEKLKQEIHDHGLEDLVDIHHRDVCEAGFAVRSVKANSVFLDLPAPWLALKHLTREGPLDPTVAVRICTFSPCIEQVQRTVVELRDCGWLDVETVEITGKRIEVRRDRVGLHEEGLRGVNASAASVDEAVTKLRDIERRIRNVEGDDWQTKEKRLASIRDTQSSRKLHVEGEITHRVESELKTHTSYLVFATLPMAWTEEDEAKARTVILESVKKGKSKKQSKREHRVSQE